MSCVGLDFLRFFYPLCGQQFFCLILENLNCKNKQMIKVFCVDNFPNIISKMLEIEKNVFQFKEYIQIQFHAKQRESKKCQIFLQLICFEKFQSNINSHMSNYFKIIQAKFLNILACLTLQSHHLQNCIVFSIFYFELIIF